MASSVASPPMTDKQLELARLLAGGVLVAADPSGVTAFAGRTWGAFKQAVEHGLGITDDDPLSSIEHGIAQGGTGWIRRDDVDGAVEVREVF